MRRKTLAALVVLTLIGVAVFALVEVAPPAILLSGDMMDIEGGKEVNGEWVEGWWVYTLTIDSSESYLSFTLADLEESHPTDPDAKIKSAGTAKVVMTRYTPYMISYPVYKAYHGIPNNVFDAGYCDTADAFYRVMGFSSTVCPYKIDLYKDGSLIDSKMGVAGDPTSVSWSTMSFSVGTAPYEAKVKDVGLMSKGLAIPIVDLSVDYTPTGYARAFSVTDHNNKLNEFSDASTGSLTTWNYQDLWNKYLFKLTTAPGINMKGADDRHALKGMPAHVQLIDLSKPSDSELWNRVIDPPYKLTSHETRTEYTGLIVAASRPDYTSATIQLKVRSELVESWVWHEPQGVPDILPIDKVETVGASTAVVTINVKNVGTSTDTFVVRVLPVNAAVESVNPREQDIEAGKIGTFYATFHTQDVADKTVETVAVEAIAMGSGETDIGYFVLEIEPKPAPNGDGTGRMSGRVVDGETMDGINNATVVVGGKMTKSDSAGRFVVEQVPVGVWSLTISVANYQGYQTEVNVAKDTTTDIGTIALTRVGIPKPWWEDYIIPAIVGVVAVIVAIIGIWLWRRRG